AKTYRYRIWNAEILDPFERGYVWHVTADLDLPAMQSAARALEGVHDFAAFQSPGSDTRTTEREISSSHVSRERGRGELLTYEITGSGFLRHMVRAIAGSLVDVGRGRHPAAWLSDVLASRDRRAAGPTAPAEGLFLVS